MATLASEVQAGDTKLQKKDNGNNMKHAQHQSLIQDIISKTQKIQRECRGRKFRDAQAKLKDAISKLTIFKEEEWPPKNVPLPPAWMKSNDEKRNMQQKVLDGAMELTRQTRESVGDDPPGEPPTSNGKPEDPPGEAVAKAATTESEIIEEKDPGGETTENDENSSNGVVVNGISNNQCEDDGDRTVTTAAESVESTISMAPKPKEHTVSLVGHHENTQIRQPMNEAIIVTLEAYILVLQLSSKTSRACEWTLECTTVMIKNRYISGVAGGREDESGSGHGSAAAEEPSLLHQLMESIAKCSESSTDTIQIAVVKTLLALMTSPKCDIHEGSMLMAVRSTFHVYLVTKSQQCKSIAKSTLIDMLKSVFNRMEAYDIMVRSTATHGIESTGNDSNDTKKDSGVVENGVANSEHTNGTANTSEQQQPNLTAFATQFHTDAYLLLRALCKLSAKALPGDDQTTSSPGTVLATFYQQAMDPLALNSKILSLELLLAVLQHAGNAFIKSEKFIYAIQNYLCVSLLKNCMSQNTQVAYLSQKIFLILVQKFKSHLKSEIEVFVANIFLRVLDSPNSSFEQKALVLEALRSLCSDPVVLTQIFLNYDCDAEAANLYKNILDHLTKLAAKSTVSTTGSVSKKDLESEFELSLVGVEVLTSTLRAFLKAMGFVVKDDEDEAEHASIRVLKMLQIDVGQAVTPSHDSSINKNDVIDKDSDHGDDTSVSSVISSSMMSPTPPLQPEKSYSGSDLAGQIVDAFEKKKMTEQNFEMGVVKFTLSLKTGLKYFIENDFVTCDAKELAKFFLKHKDKLDKTQLGEVLGREPDSAFVKGDGVDPEVGGVGFFVRILHHYVDEFDFTGLQFDDAIRLFLSGFRLPGEAQKIDRIMEKFAERYTRQNPDVFPSADTAFILGFSIIMLNTDLHNPNIKPEKRMTIESFLRNNRGISVDGGDLPEEFLTGIFNRIKSNPFSLKEDDDARARVKTKEMLDTSLFLDAPSFFSATAEERKRKKFKEEREEMMAASEKLFRRKPGKGTLAEKIAQSIPSQLTDSISPADVVKPMFDVTWGPLIGTLSQVLECAQDERMIASCLNGFVYAVRVASHSNMSTARDTFVNSLAKFTYLGSLKEMKHKNVESIRTLLSIAVIDGEYLGESWGPVLQCISQLARLRLLSSGLEGDEAFLVDKNDPASDEVVADGGGMFRPPSKVETDRQTEESNGQAVLAAVSEVLIDKVFSSTVNLSARSIAQFIEQLVEVSAMEIAGNAKRGVTGVGASSARTLTKALSTKKISEKASKHGDGGPRIYSLQRLVEVADYNMNVRPRIAWAQVWEIMGNHFAKVGCHQNAMVSIFAIDSLKQLSLKFLEKPELSEFNFQRIFLRPYLEIMENNNTREEIRELVLRCVDNMIRSMSHNLRSGWKIFFSILAISANDSSEKINTLGLAILQRLLDEHLHQICSLSDTEESLKNEDTKEDLDPIERRKRNANVDDFVGLCRASLSFIQTEESTSPLPIGLSMRALCHTACYADLLSDHRVLPPVSGAQWTDPKAPRYTYQGLSEQEALKMVLWRPLLDGLSRGISSTQSSHAGGVGCLVQRGSVITLRAILLRHGHIFTTSEWAAILKQSLLPAIQKGAESDNSKVVSITSESPSVTSLDFIADALPLPPAQDDEGLLKFATVSQSEESAPSRPLGDAELLVEASFADLRHGGDGNLSRAHMFLRKKLPRTRSTDPFPDSWVATVAPILIGMLTDMVSEVVLHRGAAGREVLWPIIIHQYRQWVVGRPRTRQEESKYDAVATMYGLDLNEAWQPCEALVTVACREIGRFPQRYLNELSILEKEEAAKWNTTLLNFFAEMLSKNAEVEAANQQELVKSKLLVYGLEDEAEECTDNNDSGIEVIVYTSYGKGKIKSKRKDTFKSDDGSRMVVTINAIQLDFGATLYRPAPGTTKNYPAVPKDINGVESEFIPRIRNLSRHTYWERFVPALKIRCVAAHHLQQSLFEYTEKMIPFAEKNVISCLLESLNQSRQTARKASENEDLSHAFQEAMFSQWGDGVEEVEEALANKSGGLTGMSNRSGSDMFFLTQQAGATKALIHMLSVLYDKNSEESLSNESTTDSYWDREQFAEPLLMENVMDVLTKFLESEQKDGNRIDPNVWRNASESGGKIAIYCTSFAAVVVYILKLMLSLDPVKFRRHKDKFFPILCSLVRVQSLEIRSLVHDILGRQIAPMIEVNMM